MADLAKILAETGPQAPIVLGVRLVLEGDEAVLAERVGGYNVVRVARVDVELVRQRIVVRERQDVRGRNRVLPVHHPQTVLVVGGLVAGRNAVK